MAIVRIGLDTSKSVFQLHGVDGIEQSVLGRKLRRGQGSGVLPSFAAGVCRDGSLWRVALLGAGATIART